MGISAYYNIQQVQITGVNGSEFIFAGLSDQTAASIKSFEGVDICWVEEAQTVTDNSWTILIPTLFRRPNCEVWLTFNPELDTDPTWKLFVENPPKGAIQMECNWRDNPWFPPELNDKRLHDQETRVKYEYEWIWEGKCKPAITGAVYADELATMFSEGRVGEYPVERQLPAYAVWDLGWNDSTAIIMCQRQQSAIRIIDYIEDSHKTLDWYSTRLKERDFPINEIFLPHDGAHNHLTGQSAERTLQDLGWKVTVLANQDVEEGIRNTRMAFRSLYIDRKCARLVECLKRYRRIIPATTQEPSKPRHDEFSHGADATRYMAQAAPYMGGPFSSGEGMKLPPLKWSWQHKGY